MKRFSITVNKIDGGILHVRSAGLIMKEAAQFVSEINVTKNEQRVNGKDILAWMGLKVSVGDILNVEVEGPDEDVVAKEFEAYLKEQF